MVVCKSSDVDTERAEGGLGQVQDTSRPEQEHQAPSQDRVGGPGGQTHHQKLDHQLPAGNVIHSSSAVAHVPSLSTTNLLDWFGVWASALPKEYGDPISGLS